MDKKNLKFDLVLLITLCTGVIFIYSTYAWFSSTLDVEISNFTITTASDSDLLISLDGITWTDRVTVNREIITNVLSETYPNHTSQWSDNLYTVSTVGTTDNNTPLLTFYKISNPYVQEIAFNNLDKFDFEKIEENEAMSGSLYIAIDLFLKNSTPSPYDDNLYLTSNTGIISVGDDNFVSNSARMGFIFFDTIANNASVDEIQNISCNNKCRSFIYEPNATKHTVDSIEDLSNHGISVTDGYSYPTYAVKSSGERVLIWSGVYNSNLELDTNYFEYQDTITSLNDKVLELGDEITKVRVYIWIEGQDVDCLERNGDGFTLEVSLGFRKEFSR